MNCRRKIVSDEQLSFFKENGYVIISDCVEEKDRKQLVADMWELSGLDKTQPKTWSSAQTAVQRNGFLEMYHNPTQWKIRTDPKLYNIFADIFNYDHLWVSIDRVCMKLPSSGKWACQGFTHWDFDPWAESAYPLHLQGAIALEDTSICMGGFHCVPGMHKYLKEWTATRPIDQEHRERFYKNGMPIPVPQEYYYSIWEQDRPIPMKAGDIVIWRGEIAHGNGENISFDPRMAFYVTMFPADETQREWIENNISIYEEKKPGVQAPYPQLGWRLAHPRRFLKDQYFEQPPIELSELGQKLIGKRKWCD